MMYFSNNVDVPPEKLKLYAYSNSLHENDWTSLADIARFAPNIQFSSVGKHIVMEKNVVSVIDSEVQLYDTVVSPTTKDVIAGYNCFLLLFGSADASLSSRQEIRRGFPSAEMDLFGGIATKILNNLFAHGNEKASDETVHVSLFEVVDDDSILDILDGSGTVRNLKTFEMPTEPLIEVEGLVSKPITSDEDISEILSKRYSDWKDLKCSNCSHSVMFATVLKKTVNSFGRGFLKVGRFTLVNVGQCLEDIFLDKVFKAKEEGLRYHPEVQNFSDTTLKKILRNAIGGNAKTTILMNFNLLPAFEKELNTANFISKIAEPNTPKICQKPIVRNSLKEYVKKIEELHLNIKATENRDGLLVCGKLDSWMKNSLINDTANLESLVKSNQDLIDTLNYKKQKVAQLNLEKSALREQVKEEEKAEEELSAELEKLRNSNHSLNENILSVANEVLSLKNVSNTSRTTTNYLKMEMAKVREVYARVTENIQMLNKDLKAFYETAEVEFLSLQMDLESILVCLKNNLESVNVEQRESLNKINDLSLNSNSASNTWKFCMDNLLSNLHAFIDNHNRNCYILREKILAEFEILNKTQQEIIDILNRNRSVKIQTVASFSHKIHISTKASIETLSEISVLLDEMQMKIKKELKAVEVIVCCAGEEFSKCISDLSISLRKSMQYFPQQENSSAEINTRVSNQQQNFRKNIDIEMQKIKNALRSIREMYTLHSACAVDLWNQRQGDFFEMERNSEDLLKSLTLLHEDLPKIFKDAFHSDNEYYYNSLKDSKENEENMHCQLKDFHDKMKCASQSCTEENQKLVDREKKEISKLLKIQGENVRKNFDSTLFMTETNSKYVSKELQNMHKQLSSSYFDSKENISANLSLLPEVERCVTQLQSVPQNVLIANDRCLNIISEVTPVNISEMDSVLDLSMSSTTFTPNRVRKELNSSEEARKLINNIRKLLALHSAKHEIEASELEKRKK